MRPPCGQQLRIGGMDCARTLHSSVHIEALKQRLEGQMGGTGQKILHAPKPAGGCPPVLR